MKRPTLKRQAKPGPDEPPKWVGSTPPDYADIIRWRLRQLDWMECKAPGDDKLSIPERREESKRRVASCHAYYKDRPAEWINHWVTTFDPRLAMDKTKSARMPFALFEKQEEVVEFVYGLLEAQANGLCEKSRDSGLTWLCCAISIHLWRYHGVSVGWGSRKQELVDKIGDPSSIFEKMRILIRELPQAKHLGFLPRGFELKAHMNFMRIQNPETGAVIIGEIGDDIGRGGRTTVYFKDESAHYEHAESIEASLMSNTNVQFDISSVSGVGTVFYRKAQAGVHWRRGQPIVNDNTNIFVFDVRDDPRKTQEWYDKTKKEKIAQGLAHKFAQEYDRDYTASQPGVVIPAEYVKACIDAHLKLGFEDDGGWSAALDVADEGLDTNALSLRKGVVLRSLEEWGERDPGRTTRRAVNACRELGVQLDLQYDAIGVGSAVKTEANRLIEERKWPRGLTLIPWFAGANPLWPERRVVHGDRKSPLNKDFYSNLKAQAWWQMRLRCERTWRAIEQLNGNPEMADFTWTSDDLVSFDSRIPLIRKLEAELSQPVKIYNTKMKMVIDKLPEGAKSPNLGDSVIMNYWPAHGARPFVIKHEHMANAKVPLRKVPGMDRMKAADHMQRAAAARRTMRPGVHRYGG